jgi:hypothetical protein
MKGEIREDLPRRRMIGKGAPIDEDQSTHGRSALVPEISSYLKSVSEHLKN